MTPLHPTNLIALRVPEGAYDFYISPGIYSLRYHTNKYGLNGTDYIPEFSTGMDKYEIIGLHPGITEDKAMDLVKNYHHSMAGYYFENYLYPGFAESFEFASQSLQSLLASHGIKENVLLILKK